MKTLFTYALIFSFFGIFTLLLLDKVLLPIITNYNQPIYLPDYRDLDYRIAQKKLDSLGFSYNIIFHNYDNTLIPYTVIEMSPRPFTKLKSGRIIKLTVANKKEDIVLDNYYNQSLRNTYLVLGRINLEIDTLIYEYNNTIEKDYIISQYPKFGKSVKTGDKITFIVSLGNAPNYYITPNLININLIKAKEIISKAGLLLGNIEYEYNQKYLNNTVLEQDKTPGMRLSFPAKIDLIVSTDK